VSDVAVRLPLELLELLHPSGEVGRRVVVLDAAAPDAPEPSDLLVLAHRAGLPAAAELADDGVAYVFAPRWQRVRLLRLLARRGLRPTAAFVHVRGADDLLVQLDRGAMTYAVATLVRPNWVLRLAARATPGRVAALAAVLAPRVGIVVRHDGATPLAAWIGGSARGLILRRAGTSGREGLFVYALGRPPIIVKVRDGVREQRQLERHGGAAARAGATVPAPVALARGPRGAGALTLLEGVPASNALRRGEADVDAVVEGVARWLTRWNLATAAQRVACERLLDDELLAHVRLLEPTMREGVAYREWLEQRAAEAVGSRLPLVTAHLDLTMANVLLTPSGKIAVLDWVQSRAEYLPLVDFFYAAVDAAAAANGYRDRVQAFRSCFGAGVRAASVRHQELTLTRALDVAAPVRELCFHACWLHHAANELRRGDDSGPFRGIVELLAARAATAARSE
jgi:hypothetical protein